MPHIQGHILSEQDIKALTDAGFTTVEIEAMGGPRQIPGATEFQGSPFFQSRLSQQPLSLIHI